MAVPLILAVAKARSERLGTSTSLQSDSFERLDSSGNLVVGSTLSGGEELVLGSATSVVHSLSDMDLDGLLTVAEHIQLADIAAPANPGAGLGALYKLTGNDGLWWKPDAAGPAVDLTAGGGGTPGGATTEVQFNEAGAFGGDPAFLWNTSTQLLTVNGMTVDSGGNVSIVGDAASTAFALTVQNTTSSGEILALQNSAGQNLFELRQDTTGEPFWFMLNAAGTEIMRFTPTTTGDNFINMGQPMGIGTTTPGAGLVLDIVGDVDFTGAVEVDGVLTVLNNYIEMDDIAAPGAGGVATGRLYKLTGSAGAWWHANGAATIDLADHDALTNFLAAEHVDWAGAGTGTIHTDNYIEGGAGTDTTAIHDDTAAEISALTLVTAAGTDHLIIEDASDGNNKKRIQVSDLLGGGTDAAAIHDNVAAEISPLTLVTVAAGDHILIEDASDSNNKKRIAASDLLGGSPAGSNHDIQFNDAGSFGGESLLTWDDVANLFSVNGLTVDTNGVLDLNDKNLTDARTITFGTPGTDTSTSGVLNIDLSENQKRNHVLDENVTSVTYTLPAGAGNFMLRIEQAAGLYSLPAAVGSWPAATEFIDDVAPVAPTADGNAILLGGYYDGTTVYWQTSGVFDN